MLLKIADRDFLETGEGYFFCVIGSKHPKSRVLAYLKYVKSNQGRWGREAFRAKRILRYYTMESLRETLEYLKREAPWYIIEAPCIGSFSAVPRRRVIKHYIPEERLIQLLSENGRDPLEEKAVSLASMLADKAGISERRMGITGSILLNIHRPEFSDIDLTVYGRSEAALVKEALAELYASGVLKRKMDTSTWRTDSIPPRRLEKLLERRWNRGEYAGTDFSILACKERSELGSLNLKSCIKVGRVVLEAIIEDDEEGIFYPAVYRISRVRVLKGAVRAKPVKLVCFNSLYSGTLLPGDTVEIRGELEVADDEARVVVGSLSLAGRDYVMLK